MPGRPARLRDTFFPSMNSATDRHTLHFPAPAFAGEDCTPIVRRLLDEMRGRGARRLVFAPGTYHFHPDRAKETYLFVANNDEGLKRIVFPLEGLDGFEIDGGGAEFVFHGALVPVWVRGGGAVVLRNFSIEWATPFHGEAEVLGAEEAFVDARLSPGFRHEVVNGNLRLVYGDGRPPAGIRNVLEFDSRRRETACLANDNYGIGERWRAEALADGVVRLHAKFSAPLPKPGNVLALMPEGRHCPAIVLDDTAGARIEDVRIHHAGGMGVIAQRCRDVTLRRVNVRARESGPRLVATTADATHFVGCSGRVTVEDCEFVGQMDDPLNIHGVYARISRRLSDDTLEVELCHRQQLGFEVARPGEEIEVVDRRTLLTKHRSRVLAVERTNRRFAILRLENAPPTGVAPGDGLGNLDLQAELVFRRCFCAANRARGLLVSTAGSVLIEENRFHVPGAAVLIAGDSNFWFESGAVRDVAIRRNHFDNCNYGVWGRAAIDINPEIEPAHRAGVRYHRNIAIERNRFTAFDRRVVRGHCVDGLSIRGNRIEHSTAYPARGEGAPMFDLTECGGVTIDGNEVDPEFGGAG